MESGQNGLSLVGTNPTMLPRRICTRVYVTNGPKTILPETRAQHGNANSVAAASASSVHTQVYYTVSCWMTKGCCGDCV
jgi:hypothetical protein